MDKSVLIELHLLPGISYFSLLKSFDNIIFEQHESFQKQSYRNRYSILSSNGILQLSVPVKKANSHIPIKEVCIDYSQNWISNHWNSIKSAYGKAPFWEFFSDDLHASLHSRPKYLFDLSLTLLTFCLNSLQTKLDYSFSNNFETTISKDIYDARETIHPKKKSVMTSKLHLVSYHQVFGNEFVNNLSIIDLIFNEGLNAKSFISPLSMD